MLSRLTVRALRRGETLSLPGVDEVMSSAQVLLQWPATSQTPVPWVTFASSAGPIRLNDCSMHAKWHQHVPADALEAAAVAVVCIGDRELSVDLTASPGAVRPWTDPEHTSDSAGAAAMRTAHLSRLLRHAHRLRSPASVAQQSSAHVLPP